MLYFLLYNFRHKTLQIYLVRSIVHMYLLEPLLFETFFRLKPIVDLPFRHHVLIVTSNDNYKCTTGSMNIRCTDHSRNYDLYKYQFLGEMMTTLVCLNF